MIGTPAFPPYWSLGFQLSRWGYNNTEAVRELRKNMKHYRIPQVCIFEILSAFCLNLELIFIIFVWSKFVANQMTELNE